MDSKEQIIKLVDNNVNEIQHLIMNKARIWLDYIVFSDLWWMGVALSVIPWIIWYIFRKKQSTDRLLYVGFFVITISIVLDVLGDQFGLWHYRFNVIPVLPTYLPWDITLMPVTILFFLQINPNVSPWYKAIIFALGTSYLAEPFFHWLKVYRLISWHYTYSVPIQVIIYMCSDYISRRNKFLRLND